MKAAVYVRVSTDQQSTEVQRHDIERFVAHKNWEIAYIYEDKLSGASSRRPGLQQMLEDARKGKFQVIVTYKLDRFFRSLKDLLTTLHDLRELGIDFVAVRDNLDFTTSQGMLMIHLLGAIGQFERELTLTRVRAGVENARRKGIRFGRPPTINRNDARLLSEQGFSLSQIAKRLGCSKSAVHKVVSEKSFRNSDKKWENTENVNLNFAVQNATVLSTTEKLPTGVSICHENEKQCHESDFSVTADKVALSK